jgi:hypothetical protein
MTQNVNTNREFASWFTEWKAAIQLTVSFKSAPPVKIAGADEQNIQTRADYHRSDVADLAC